MTLSGTDFTLEELLSDPVTRAVMKADGVDPSSVEAMWRGLTPVVGRGAHQSSGPAFAKGPGCAGFPVALQLFGRSAQRGGTSQCSTVPRQSISHLCGAP
jgi:hypothetical protein